MALLLAADKKHQHGGYCHGRIHLHQGH